METYYSFFVPNSLRFLEKYILPRNVSVYESNEIALKDKQLDKNIVFVSNLKVNRTSILSSDFIHNLNAYISLHSLNSNISKLKLVLSFIKSNYYSQGLKYFSFSCFRLHEWPKIISILYPQWDHSFCPNHVLNELISLFIVQRVDADSFTVIDPFLPLVVPPPPPVYFINIVQVFYYRKITYF